MKRRPAEEKELAERASLLRAWKKFHREERDAALTGPHGAVLAELFRMFKNLAHMRPAQLIGYTQSIDWGSIDYNTKLIAIHELNNAITAFREKHGLEPIDDPLPGQPDNAFRIIKALFESFPSQAGEHTEVSSVNKGV